MKLAKRLSAIILIIAFLLVSATLFTACNDGKCDNCSEKAIENDEALTGVEGEYCNTCLAEEILKAAGDVFTDLMEKYE